jgi:hypothetical protein
MGVQITADRSHDSTRPSRPEVPAATALRAGHLNLSLAHTLTSSRASYHVSKCSKKDIRYMVSPYRVALASITADDLLDERCGRELTILRTQDLGAGAN